ncbi:hypothetical protein GRB70_40490, partial [Bradyrhizobium neotropicale]|nr:hypothetical protein [Bradyrhizobium neotropicale]
ARLNLLLNELRLPAIKLLWPQFAEQSDKEGWPAARFLATIGERDRYQHARLAIQDLFEPRTPLARRVPELRWHLPTGSNRQFSVHKIAGAFRAVLSPPGAPGGASGEPCLDREWGGQSGYCSRTTLAHQRRKFALERVASLVAVRELRADLAQIAVACDQLAAQPAESLRIRRATVHQHEVHLAPPNAKQ